MALESLPIWLVAPDWRDGISESIEWKTNVRASRSAAEQRDSVRISPRRVFDISFTTSGVNYQRLMRLVEAWGGGEQAFYMPLWHQTIRLPTAQSGTISSFAISTAGREFILGGAAILFNEAEPTKSALAEIDDIQADSLGVVNFSDGGNPWPARSPLYPARRFVLLSDGQEVRRRSRTTGQATLRFLSLDTDDWPPATFLDTHAGFPVITMRPNEAEDISYAYSHVAETFDPGFGKRKTVAVQGSPSTRQNHYMLTKGVTEAGELRAFLYALQGRLVGAWLPSWSDDFTLGADASSGASTIYVRDSLYGYVGFPQEGRDRIMIEMVSGTRYYRQVVSIGTPSADNEALVLNASIPEALTANTVRRICLMSLSRLDQDSVEIVHHTDAEGATTATLSFVSTPKTRTGDAWSPLALEFTSWNPLPCGTSQCSNTNVLLEVPFKPIIGFDYRSSSWPAGGMANSGWRSSVWTGNWNTERNTALATMLNLAWGGNPGLANGTKPIVLREFNASGGGDYESTGPICSQGILPLGLMEQHQPWKLFPSLPVNAYYDWNLVLAVLLETGYTTFATVRIEIIDKDGVTVLFSATSTLFDSEAVTGGAVAFYHLQTPTDGQPIAYPTDDPMEYLWMPEEGFWYLLRITKLS